MKTVKCPQCSMVNWATLDFCKRCSCDLTIAIQEAAAKQMQLEENFAVPKAQMPQAGSKQNFSQPAPSFSDDNSGHYVNAGYQQEQQQQNWNGQNAHQQNYGNNYSGYQNNRDFRGANVNASKKMAIVSMILGIISFPGINVFLCTILAVILGTIFGAAGGVIGAVLGLSVIPVGLITGIAALRKANKQPMKFGGKGFAIAGIALSGFGLLVIPVVGAIAVPNLLAARRAANEGSAISTMKTITKAENSYMSSMGGKCGDLQTLIAGRLIDSVLSNGEKSGYRFMITNLPMGGCEIHAAPMVAEGVSSTGNRSFYASSDDQWTIRAADKNGSPASKADTPINSDYSAAPPRNSLSNGKTDRNADY